MRPVECVSMWTAKVEVSLFAPGRTLFVLELKTPMTASTSCTKPSFCAPGSAPMRPIRTFIQSIFEVHN